MKIGIEYIPVNWNEYINKERHSFYIANSIKQKEKEIVRLATKGLEYKGKYPIGLTIYAHFKDKRQDLDNVRVKGLIDGLVSNKVIKNDNLNCIQEIRLVPVFDSKTLIEIEIREI